MIASGTIGKCSASVWFGEQPVQSSGRLNRRHIAVAAQIEKLPIGVNEPVMAVDQNAERNAIEESRLEQLPR
jgi:hypothetical protein